MPNRLADSTSPYLLQHQNNPVDWWEWSEGAFAEARQRNVPVLLSVGYSACHWCHVMAHESFEDPATAAVMNERFVNIKVDREERPDIDSIYMEAVQAMSGQGGWPMTVWMTPDARPFYAGTYFPSQPHHGMPAFSQVLDAIWHAWTTDKDKVLGQADQLVEAISRSVTSGEIPDAGSVARALSSILQSFDATFGGFGAAPKFPQQPVLDFLLRARSLDPVVDHALQTTLTRMADGGIHDHLGGGFARYSVDRKWLVPHFEKMLYDNAQLARIYLWAGIEFGEDRYLNVARSTIDFLLTDLRHPEGGFYSAEDADSEGEEGTFYIWTSAEFGEVLGDLAGQAAIFYGVTSEGNFEGANILHLSPDLDVPPDLGEIKRKLLERRNQRTRPGLDDKVIAAWNGLAIRALAESGAALDSPAYLEAAERAASFVLDNMMVDGTLQRSWRAGKNSGPGYLDDYAAMAIGCFSLYAATGEVGWYEAADRLVSGLGAFARAGGGYFATSEESEQLIKRPEDITDNPLPSGNALAAEALLISSLYTGDLQRRDAAGGALSTVAQIAQRYPSMVGHHLAVAHSMTQGTREVAIVGRERSEMVRVFWGRYRPETALAQGSGSSNEVPLLVGRIVGAGGETMAYVCRNFECNLPTDSVEGLAQQLAMEHPAAEGG
jgi:uncharacterized protein